MSQPIPLIPYFIIPAAPRTRWQPWPSGGEKESLGGRLLKVTYLENKCKSCGKDLPPRPRAATETTPFSQASSHLLLDLVEEMQRNLQLPEGIVSWRSLDLVCELFPHLGLSPWMRACQLRPSSVGWIEPFGCVWGGSHLSLAPRSGMCTPSSSHRLLLRE